MTTPSDPQTPGENPVPAPPEPTPEQAAAAQQEQEQAQAAADQTDAIRALATELFQQLASQADYCTLKKGSVVSIQNTASPPTLTITLSGSTTQIPGVRYVDSYAPVAGDTVDVLWQASSVLVLGQVALNYAESTWTTAPLVNGNSHNGNGNGTFQMRRVWDHGSWRVDLQGGINFAGNNIVNSLDTKYRPVNATRRTVICSRDGTGENSVKVDFGADGTVVAVGLNTAPAAATPNDSTHNHGQHEHGIDDSTHQHPSHDHSIPNNDHFHGGATGTTSSHSHSISTTSHSHGGGTGGSTAGDSTHSHSGTTQMTTPNDSTHNHGSHSHVVDTPVWISFNGLHYYL